MTAQITAGRFHAADGVEDWRSLYHVVSAYFRTGSLTKGIGLADEAKQQYLQVDLRHAGVTVSLGLRDVALARRISAAARELDIPADPTAVQLINVTLDTLVGGAVLPFWRALLGYGQIGDDYLFDPLRRGPGFGLQQMTPCAHNATACTSISPSRTTRPRPASQPPWPRAAIWSPMRTRRCGGSWPTPRATRRASPPGSAGNS